MSNSATNRDQPWLASYDTGVPYSIDYEHALLSDFLRASSSSFPDNMALQFQGYELSYRQLDALVDKFATALIDFGVEKGDSVAILLPNTIPCVISYCAILRIGAIAVMNCPLYSDRELLYQFRDSSAKVLITLDLLGNRMIDLREQTQITHIIITSIGDYLPFPQKYLFPLVAKRKKLSATVRKGSNVHYWGELINNISAREIDRQVDFNDTAMYQYTGGTTGQAKGVILTHGNISKQVQQVSAWFPGFARGEEVVLGALPFFHVFGLSGVMNFAIHMGWGNILVPKPEPQKLLQTIKKYRPTFGAMVPTMYIGMLNHPDMPKIDMTCFKGFFSGSAPLPLEVFQKFEKIAGAVIVEGYGLTETSPITHINPFNGRRKIGSVGIPLPDTTCRVVDVADAQKDAAVGQPGELLIQGPQVMKGYLNRDEDTENVFEDGWLKTGDIAKMDEDGYFYIVDRIKDMVISGGFNVYPREIDEVLHLHPQVKEASSVGIPHPTRGEQVHSFVVVAQDSTATAEELIEFCGKRLATYKLPTAIKFVDSLPRTAVGKVQREQLRKQSQ